MSKFLLKVFVSVAVLIIGVSRVAMADDVTVCDISEACVVGHITVKDIGVFISAPNHVGPMPESCSNSSNFFIDITEDYGRAMYSAALTAKASDAKVIINITDSAVVSGNCMIRDFRVL